MKRWISILLALVMVLTLAACGATVEVETQAAEMVQETLEPMAEVTSGETGSASGGASSGEASFGPASGGMTSVEITGPFEIEETDVQCQSYGLTLRGKMVVPITDGTEKLPMAVLTHGFTSTHSDMNEIAEALGKNGIASVRFDLTGNGVSDGEYVDTTFTTQKEDILNELAFVKTLDFVDTDKLFLCGKSQGGFDSAMAAVDCADEICGLILWYPALCIPEDFKVGRVMFTGFDVDDIPETLAIQGNISVSRAFIEEGMSIVPNEDFTAFEKSVLIIHGDSDNIAPYPYAETLAAAYADAEFILIEGGGHGFSGDGLLMALDATVNFIQEQGAED